MIQEPRRFRVLWSTRVHNGYDVIDSESDRIIKSFHTKGDAELLADDLNEKSA